MAMKTNVSLMKEVKNVDVMSVAKIYTVFGAVGGLIIGVIEGLLFIFMGLLGTATGPGGMAGGIFLVILGAALLIGAPLLGALGGFIGGLLRGVIYNWAAEKWGGIKVKLD